MRTKRPETFCSMRCGMHAWSVADLLYSAFSVTAMLVGITPSHCPTPFPTPSTARLYKPLRKESGSAERRTRRSSEERPRRSPNLR